MNQLLLDLLKPITKEEKEILDGFPVKKSIYSATKDFVIDSRKMLEQGKLIDIRPHTRYVHFPKHRHNYIEIIYMCIGQTKHLVNDTETIILKQGELLFLNHNVTQEIFPADSNDIAINFIILPEFFDLSFSMIKGENILRDFWVSSLCENKKGTDYIHFQVSDILPIQNLVENMIWSILYKQKNHRQINQATMGLLLMQLLNHTDKISLENPKQLEQNLIFSILNYIEENYKTATLNELADLTNISPPQLSRFIKKKLSSTFKVLLKTRRLRQAIYLLSNTSLPVEQIILAVGYDNSSYFHHIFKEQYGQTPKAYRMQNAKTKMY